MIPKWAFVSALIAWVSLALGLFLAAIWNAFYSVTDARARLARIQWALWVVVMLGICLLALYFVVDGAMGGRHA